MRRLRRALIALAAALAICSTPAGAATTGVIRGVVVNESTDEPQPGVRVTLTSGTASGDTTTRTVTTDDDGRYTFRDLPTGEDRFYTVDARYEGGLFSGDAITIPDDTKERPVFDTKLRVWETTDDPSAILLRRDALIVVQDEDGTTGVIESITVLNQTGQAYVGRGGGAEAVVEEGPAPSLGVALPAGARGEDVSVVEASINVPELVRTSYGFGITAAIPPGETQITFSYAVRGSGGSYDLSRKTLYPTVELSVFAAEPLDVSSNRLTERGTVVLGGKEYREYRSESGMDAGDSVQVLALADAGTPPGLVAGMAGVLALVVALGAFPLLRRRRHDAVDDPLPQTRDEVVRRIAELDVRHKRGEVSDDDWASERARLRSALEDATTR